MRSRAQAELLVSAAATAALGTAICYDAMPGLNWTLWTLLVSAELLAFARPRLGANRAAFDVTLASAVLLAGGAAITANPMIFALIFMSVALLLAVATRLAAGIPAPLIGLGDLMLLPVVAPIDTICETVARLQATVRAAFTEAGAHVVRGLAIAIPVVAIFAALLSTADPTMGSWMDALSNMLHDWSWVPRLMLFCALGTASLGAFSLAVGGLTKPATPWRDGGPPTWIAGDTERRIVIGAVDALFALFLVLVAFDSVPRGQSYTEYVHKGFAQLTIVATLSVLLVARLHHGRPRAGIPWGTLALLAEVELLVASALHRILVYQRDFGYTALRLWVTVYMLLVAALIIIVTIEVARPRLVDARRFMRRGALLSIGTLILMVYGNPDAWVVSLELHRYETTGKIDAQYLGTLSLDAVPSILRAADALPAACRDGVRSAIQWHRWPEHWYESTLRRARAKRALREAPFVMHPGLCVVPAW